MSSTPLFDYADSQARKREGMELAADASSDLELARSIARELALAHPDRTTNADHVGDQLQRRHGIMSLGPAAGSLFKGGGWEFTGVRIRSARVKNHGREIREWRFKG